MRKADRILEAVDSMWESDVQVDFAQLKDLLPEEPLPRLIRQFWDVHDALEAYGSISAGGQKISDARKLVRDSTLFALGGWDRWPDAYATLAELEAELLRGSRAEKTVAEEINTIVRPLLDAYRDPRHFFAAVAPSLFPDDFDLKLLLGGAVARRPGLGHTWWKWGYLSFLNPNVAAAAAAADPNRLIASAARAEGKAKPPKRRGRKPERHGIHDQIEKLRQEESSEGKQRSRGSARRLLAKQVYGRTEHSVVETIRKGDSRSARDRNRAAGIRKKKAR